MRMWFDVTKHAHDSPSWMLSPASKLRGDRWIFSYKNEGIWLKAYGFLTLGDWPISAVSFNARSGVFRLALPPAAWVAACKSRGPPLIIATSWSSSSAALSLQLWSELMEEVVGVHGRVEAAELSPRDGDRIGELSKVLVAGKHVESTPEVECERLGFTKPCGLSILAGTTLGSANGWLNHGYAGSGSTTNWCGCRNVATSAATVDGVAGSWSINSEGWSDGKLVIQSAVGEGMNWRSSSIWLLGGLVKALPIGEVKKSRLGVEKMEVSRAGGDTVSCRGACGRWGSVAADINEVDIITSSPNVLIKRSRSPMGCTPPPLSSSCCSRFGPRPAALSPDMLSEILRARLYGLCVVT